MDSTDHSTAVARCEDVLLNTHQNLCFCSCFFRLNHVQVHFVAVEVSVVWGTHSQVEPESVTFHDANFVNHHRHAVKRRLSVEDGNVSVDQVSLDEQTWLRVTVAVNGGQAIFDPCSVAPFICRAATVRAGDLEVLWKRFWVSLVGLCQIPHPAVVELCPWVILREAVTMFVFASEVSKGCVVVNDVGRFCRSIGGDADLWLDDQTR